MAKIQNISEIHPTLGFTEFDILEKNSLTGGTPHFVRQTPPVGRSETLTGSSFLLQWSTNTNTEDEQGPE